MGAPERLCFRGTAKPTGNSFRAEDGENLPLEAEEEAEGGFAGAGAACDGEVVLLEVGR
jgi:hypothetical protein